jgi:hypothetical protein
VQFAERSPLLRDRTRRVKLGVIEGVEIVRGDHERKPRWRWDQVE